LWISPVRPGREHDATAARADPDLLDDLAAWVDDGQLGLADLGYEGEADLLRIPIKKPADSELTVDQQAYSAVHGASRCLRERANSLLKTTFKALRRWRGCPGASTTSSPQHSSCSTTNTTGQHDQHGDHTQ
jgi:DDE superfamily endonuclease